MKQMGHPEEFRSSNFSRYLTTNNNTIELVYMVQQVVSKACYWIVRDWTNKICEGGL